MVTFFYSYEAISSLYFLLANIILIPFCLELVPSVDTKLATVASDQQTETTHNLYHCNDVSCQRILKTMLLQKFDDLKSHIVEDKSTSGAGVSAAKPSLTLLRASTFFEDYLITIVKYLSQKKWKTAPTALNQEQPNHGATKNTLATGTTTPNDLLNNATTKSNVTTEPTDENCTCNLLYLATALNLPGFIHIIFQWVDTNPHAKLVRELDCQVQDSAGYTPLVSIENYS